MQKRPVFIALVGPDTRTDDLYDCLSRRLAGSFIGQKISLLGDPFEEHSTVNSGRRRRPEVSAMARFFERWSLFAEFNAKIVAPTFRDKSEIILTRRYGFDLIAGARPHDCRTQMLEIHKLSVQKCIVDLGIAPPLYVFSSNPSPLENSLVADYFALPGQEYTSADYRLSPASQADAIVRIISDRLAERDKRYAAA